MAHESELSYSELNKILLWWKRLICTVI